MPSAAWKTKTFTATVTDDFGASATETVTITITGTNDSPVIVAGGNTGSVVEAGNTASGSVVPALSLHDALPISTDVDAGATATWTISGASTHGSIAITTA